VRNHPETPHGTHMPYPVQAPVVGSWDLCWCCGRRLVDHPSLCHCGQPHYCEGRPPNWSRQTGSLRTRKPGPAA
jgi:hypothetical protein